MGYAYDCGGTTTVNSVDDTYDIRTELDADH